MKKYLLVGLLTTVANVSFSEDIELYISDSVKQAKARPQVLIIFDNSGSMSRNETVKESYDPNTNYDAVSGYTKQSNDYIYYTKGQVDISQVPIADDTNEKRKFVLDISNCKIAQDIIDQYGFYTGYVREYTFQGNSGRWTELNEADGSGIYITDCADDVLAGNDNNKNYLSSGTTTSLDPGFPVDGEGDSANPQFYTTDIADSNVEWSGSLVTLYSDNYLRWYHNPDIPTESKDRIDIAQESVTNLINSSPNVDFGLQVFNRSQGGRIVFGITESNLASRAAILNIVNNNLNAENWTPLCETLYEASLYFAGKSVDYGDVHSSPTPPRDTSIETAGKIYKSPFNSCSDRAYVILITDGEPTYDIGADSNINDLPDIGPSYYISEPKSWERGSSMLPALAGWMNNNDVNSSVDGKQTVSTYTIGFGQDAQDDAEPLLKETAKLGGGKYFPAQDTASLTAALTNVLANLEPSNDSLTSASVAANNFDRTETLNSVYYAMFQPDRGPRWQGNLKKYKVVGGVQKGKNGNLAIDEGLGHFSTEVTSFWSNVKDGDQVAEGGVADMLRNKSTRMVYSDIGTDNALLELNDTNTLAHYGSAQNYADFIGVDVAKYTDYFNWNVGIDVDDEDDDGDKTDMRFGVFGDPLHSKPLVVNYGDKIHLVVGTNAGALHMFKDSGDTVDETWAFMPKEFFPNIPILRDNYSTSDKTYGVDGKITSYINDKDGDGIIETGDTVWIFFGLRRGGTSYYALDISNPNAPSLMWHIDAGTSGFGELGQSWSQPKVGYSKINIVDGAAKPVLFFGGGYDTSKDNVGVGTADNVGRAIYMVDAETGTLKWSMAPENAITTFVGTDSIPASVSTLDSDGDGLVDRLYAGDTGGNVWRVDMPSDNPTGSDPWSVFQLASLGGEDTNAVDRRFFYEPTVVRTFITETLEEQVTAADGSISTVTVNQEIPYDAVLLGSGDRSNPLGTDTDDIFFMIKDRNIITQTFSDASTPATPSAITVSDLYDFTDDPFGNVSAEGEQALAIAVSEKSGWYFLLTQDGEKSTSSGIVINNTVYFTTFTPPNLSEEQVSCELPNGQGWLYGVDLARGTSKFKWSEEDNSREDRIAFISEQFLGSPTLIVIPEDDGDPDTIDDAVGNLIVGRKMIEVGFNLRTMRTYLYVTEDR
ncbi:MAG: rRNA (guanine-N1)-methyltransferase [Colwellia sp.]|nr:rRNA (guanine-N1)-methyltransferase [Colwellia sp.]